MIRKIEYTFDDPGWPGSGATHLLCPIRESLPNGHHRLLTTLLDARKHPAKHLIVLYHERWEEELAIDKLKTHQRERPVLRSETPGGVLQEIYRLLLGHFVIRKLMCEAAATLGCVPWEASFVNTLKILRCRLPPRSPRGQQHWYHDLMEEIAEERLTLRRNRINPQVIKRKISNRCKKCPKHNISPQPTKTFREFLDILN